MTVASAHLPLILRRGVMLTHALLLTPSLLLAACHTLPTPPKGVDDGGVTAPATPAVAPPVPALAPPAAPRAVAAAPAPTPARRGTQRPYTIAGVTYHPQRDSQGYAARGTASWYGAAFHGRRTSSGEPFDMHALTAAHRTLPLPSYVLVRNLRNQRSTVVKVNDRGPFIGDRLIDLSFAAAKHLGLHQEGHGPVEVIAVGPEALADAPWRAVHPDRRTASTRRGRPSAPADGA